MMHDGEEIDQSQRLSQARHESSMIARHIDSVTDKYIGGCSY